MKTCLKLENDSKFGKDIKANLRLKSGEEDSFGSGRQIS